MERAHGRAGLLRRLEGWSRSLVMMASFECVISLRVHRGAATVLWRGATVWAPGFT